MDQSQDDLPGKKYDFGLLRSYYENLEIVKILWYDDFANKFKAGLIDMEEAKWQPKQAKEMIVPATFCSIISECCQQFQERHINQRKLLGFTLQPNTNTTLVSSQQNSAGCIVTKCAITRQHYNIRMEFRMDS